MYVSHTNPTVSGTRWRSVVLVVAGWLLLGTNVFAADVVVLECGEYNFGPGISIVAVDTSLKTIPQSLAVGSSCAVAITNLLTKGFKIQDIAVSTAQFFAADNVIHSYTLTSN
jgi:hypothetical protein